MVKRSRNEDPSAGLAQHLEAAADSLNGDGRHALKALTAVKAAIDCGDEQYEVQKALVSGGALAALARLLNSEAESVSVAAADALLSLTQHSPAVMDRLVVGGSFTMGNPESVSFNPVQSDVLDYDIITTLVRLQFEGSEAQQDAAFAALAGLSAFNRSNKLAQLHDLVRRLIDGQAKAMQLVEATLDSMDFKDDVAVVLDMALGSILGTLSSGTPEEQLPAASLLGVVLAKRPAIAEFLVAEGALRTTIELLTAGDPEIADVAVAAIWGLVKGSPRLLRPDNSELGMPATALVPPLLDILKRSRGSIPDVDISDDNDDSGTSDNGESAAALLRALARADPAVMELVKSDTYASPAATAAALPSRCCIM